jgi:hypothetical protein
MEYFSLMLFHLYLLLFDKEVITLQTYVIASQQKESIMNQLDTLKIIREAKEVRAAEMQRIQGLMTRRIGLYFRLLAGSATDAGNSLQPLFSWNPQDAAPRRVTGPSPLTRASLALRTLFSWNPQAHRT